MNTQTLDRIRHALSEDFVRKLLIKFFVEAGYQDSFDRLLYPPVAEGIALKVPQLMTKVEIEPYAIEVDPMTNTATLGWNLYVLGSHRMFLGETKHGDLKRMAQELRQGQQIVSGTAIRQVTPRRVVNFISHVLGRSENGYIDPDIVPQPIFKPRFLGAISPSMSSSFMGARH